MYFLINFTVDVLAMYFSLMLARISASRIRLIVSGIIGAGAACITVLFNMRPVFYILNLILTFFLMVLISAGSVTMLKRFKVYVAFIVIETLLGGLITYLYGVLDKYFAPFSAPSDCNNFTAGIFRLLARHSLALK